MNRFELLSFPNTGALARVAAGDWVMAVAAANLTGAVHRVALSGGRLARDFFSVVTAEARVSGVSFDAVHFFWADERCVPPDEAESNFSLARQHLLGPLGIDGEHIHRIRGEADSHAAAREAEAALRRIAPLNDAGQPVLDLVFLGLGEDGHVASLFPGEPEAVKADHAVYRGISGSPKPPANRVTLGYAALAAAREVWVLASGPGKAAALRDSLSPSGRTPLAEVLRRRAHTRLYTDIPLT